MSTHPRVPRFIFFLVIFLTFLFLIGCGGTPSQTAGTFSGNSTGSPSGSSASPGNNSGGTTGTAPAATLSSVSLNPSTVTAGTASTGTVALSAAAPAGGAEVAVSSSNPSAATVPAKVMVTQGQASATFQATTAAVASATAVTISASYNNAVAGATLTVNPQPATPPPSPPPPLPPATPSPDFTFGVNPASFSAAQGGSVTATITTAVSNGFNSAVMLSSSGAPAGASVNFNPASIAAPGSGTSQVLIAVASSAPAGTYAIVLTGFGGGLAHTASISLTITTAGSPGATGPLHGCLLTDSGHKYQAVQFSLSAAATLPFDGLLFRGPTCDPAQKVDEIGFLQPMQFGGFGWTFWFIHFPDQLDTSGIWTLGTDKSACIDYSTAPPCQ